jgi:DNA-binding MarR family transcriptional regulator
VSVTTASGDRERPGLFMAAGPECADREAGLLDSLTAGRCGTAPVNLPSLGEADARQALAGQTARFAAAFLRWIDSRAGSGMSYGRLRLLQALHCRGPAIMRDLGTELGASPRNMTALVDALEEASLVVRRPHPTDRRATLVELSPAGVREAEQSLDEQLDAMSAIFGTLSAAEQEQFFAAIAKLVQAMKDGGQSC